MELWFLGTGAGRPTPDRNVTSVALRLSQGGDAFWLFDCGEGTQHRLLRTPLKLTRLKKLFVTHLHGDHVFGLPGLLSSRSSLGGTEPLELYGPPGLRELLETSLRVTGAHLDYPLAIEEIGEGFVCEDEGFTVEAAKLDHRIDCFGYRVAERPRAGVLRAAWLKEQGVPPGPLYGRLKAGEDVELPDGRVIRSAVAVGPPLAGRVVAVLGDTRPTGGAFRLARGADVLVHEATFAHGLAEKAWAYGHSTALQAAEVAREAGARRLLITHFSARYKPEDLAELEREARTVFGGTEAAVELRPYAVARSVE
ncbi:ribonuclease Z [Cohnella caldifontis]|uniref:ribonuclease Z n=1 Tax=Cohnella caldifontis TaxID=3027471 RepID=UPI0023EDF9AC|nr:ribonuclease Z [Cohnella sp. YIM B05605]